MATSVKRPRKETMPVRNITKVADLSSDNFKSIIKEGNREVLDKLINLTGEVISLKKENENLKQKIVTLRTENESDRKRKARLEDQVKCKYLIFKVVSNNKSTINEVKKVCRDILDISDINIFKAVKKLLDSVQSTYAVLGKTKKLKGTDIYIEKDLNEERQRDKRAMLMLKKNVIKISKIHCIVLREDQMES
ncbi:hypothetical protein FF38_01739 [Lucilia cuprina]|uniref:Uncharacterized protein n=1 Tax=Lucilia cuprina TaxID=7375 RepID=A0A0L0BYN5_LUCCU|nr:hypothetical protein FF38_01739 [Lucilia cuprina]